MKSNERAVKHQQSLPLFTLHSSLFTLRVQKGAGTHMRLASRAGEPPPPQRPSPQNLATRRSHVTHSSLFTLHSSLFRFRESVGPCMAGPWSAGRLVGLLTDLRATSRSHSSLFTLHSSDFERVWVPVWLGPGRLVGWWGCSLISARPRDHTLHFSLFTLHSSLFTGAQG